MSCETDFYESSLSQISDRRPVDIFPHEAILVTAPFCCKCRADSSAKGYDGDYALAAGFCNGLLLNLEDLGVVLCPNINRTVFPPCYLCGECGRSYLPDAVLPFVDISCGDTEEAGLAGLIGPEECEQGMRYKPLTSYLRVLQR